MITVNTSGHVETILSLCLTPVVLLELKFLHIQTHFYVLGHIVCRNVVKVLFFPIFLCAVMQKLHPLDVALLLFDLKIS